MTEAEMADSGLTKTGLTKTGPAKPESSAILLEGVTRTYEGRGGAVHALRGIELAIAPGSLVALRGRSGSGKTTLLNIIGGIDQATEGRVRVLGTDVTSLGQTAAAEWRRTTLGFVFQSHGLVTSMTAFENVEVALRIAGIPRRERADRVNEHLAMVGLLDWSEHRPDELSGGQRQRVAIARATAADAQLVIADEPTGELDVETGSSVLSTLRTIVDTTGSTIVVATHDPALDDFADRVVHLSDGTIDSRSHEDTP